MTATHAQQMRIQKENNPGQTANQSDQNVMGFLGVGGATKE